MKWNERMKYQTEHSNNQKNMVRSLSRAEIAIASVKSQQSSTWLWVTEIRPFQGTWHTWYLLRFHNLSISTNPQHMNWQIALSASTGNHDLFNSILILFRFHRIANKVSYYLLSGDGREWDLLYGTFLTISTYPAAIRLFPPLIWSAFPGLPL